MKKTLAQQQTEEEQLRAQVMALAVQSGDPDAGNRVQLEQLRAQLAVTERNLKAFDRTLVAPSQAPALLHTLLARHRGLSLVSLTTLAPLPLIDTAVKKPVKDGEKPATAKEEAAPPMPGGNIYKHGIEIKLAGSYHDLLAYVAELEASPQKLLWGGMSLAAKSHPLNELTLTVYTLSLDATWLVV
jgi:MSHA biogenesis protein MshJ